MTVQDGPAVESVALLKSFGSGANALDGVNLRVPQGSVFGFLGPNGAGKTTMLRILTGLARPTSGTVRVLGYPVGDPHVRGLIGYLPDVPAFYPWMSADEYLRFCGGLFGLNGSTLAARTTALLDLAGLSGVTTRIGGYSRGMRQRLGIAQALINAPQLLLLDEPTSALDPLGRRDVLEMVGSLTGRTTVFFSTHILADAERVCDSVAILDHGRVVTEGSMADIKSRFGATHLELEVVGGADVLAGRLRGADWVTDVVDHGGGALVLTVSDMAAAERGVPAMVTALGLGLRRFEAGEVSLEEAFIDVIGGTVTAGAPIGRTPPDDGRSVR
ncbi:MAG: ABC transporter ATP-binding protein [Actinomycetes bacterium]